MFEKWKIIKSFPNYEVSTLGRVRSRNKNLVLKPSVSGSGYYQVGLSGDGRYKMIQVHRLVAMAFIDNPDNYPCVNHRNENRLDNQADNLEWCTQRYNVYYGQNSIARRVRQETQKGKCVAVYDSQEDAASITGIAQSSISRACRKERKTAGGFVWKFA